MLLTPPNSPDNPNLKRIKREKNRSSSDESDNNDIPLVIKDFRCAKPVYLSIPLTHLRALGKLNAVWREQGLEADISPILKDYNLLKAVANPSILISAFTLGKKRKKKLPITSKFRLPAYIISSGSESLKRLYGFIKIAAFQILILISQIRADICLCYARQAQGSRGPT
jgi:hypothetical protein